MNAVKMMGVALIFSSCSIYGLVLSSEYDRRIKSLSNMKKALLLLKGEIKYNNAGIGESFKKVSDKTDAQIRQMFYMVYEALQKGDKSLKEIWDTSMEQCLKKGLCLTESDLVSIRDFGTNLGITDRDTQINNIAMCLDNIDSTIDELKKHRQEKCKLYKTLGFMSGALIGIVLI